MRLGTLVMILELTTSESPEPRGSTASFGLRIQVDRVLRAAVAHFKGLRLVRGGMSIGIMENKHGNNYAGVI